MSDYRILATIVSNPAGCVACVQAKRWWLQHGVAFVEQNAADFPEKVAALPPHLDRTLPIVYFDGNISTGFRPDLWPKWLKRASKHGGGDEQKKQ